MEPIRQPEFPEGTHSAENPKGAEESCAEVQRDDPVTGELRREHWRVPVPGPSVTDPDGVVQAIARRDGTVILHLTYGGAQTTVQLDIGRAAQLSTGIWEAAGTAQQLAAHPGADHPPAPLLPRSADLPPVWPAQPHRTTPSRHRPSRRRPTPAPANKGAATDTARTIGRRIRRLRTARAKSLQVVSGLAGMSRSTLWRIEHGQRELTLSEIVTLAHALEITPTKLITLPALEPTRS